MIAFISIIISVLMFYYTDCVDPVCKITAVNNNSTLFRNRIILVLLMIY